MIINDLNILKTPSIDVKLDEANDLISSLEKELNYSALIGKPGIGLALPQVGVNKKAAIVRINNNGAYDLSVNLVNARIAEKYNPFTFKEEGCLSFEGKLLDTVRYQEIYVVDNLVPPHSFVATGLMAVAIQHELDHLDGVLFFDRAVQNTKSKVKPNDPCICGKIDVTTGRVKKYKKCCQGKQNG